MNITNNIPSPSAPFLSSDGQISQVWWGFLVTLFNRTGSTQGYDATALSAAISELQIESAAPELLHDDSINRRLNDIELTVQDGRANEIGCLQQRIHELEMQIAAQNTAIVAPVPAGYITLVTDNVARTIAYY